jgi:hypothetical protein
VLNQDGEIIDERTVTNHRESLRRLSQKYPGARIACEVGSHSPWIKRFLTELGHEVFVANAPDQPVYGDLGGGHLTVEAYLAFRAGIDDGDGGFFFMDVESDVECGCRV